MARPRRKNAYFSFSLILFCSLGRISRLSRLRSEFCSLLGSVAFETFLAHQRKRREGRSKLFLKGKDHFPWDEKLFLFTLSYHSKTSNLSSLFSFKSFFFPFQEPFKKRFLAPPKKALQESWFRAALSGFGFR
jgi:hypothetical protein